MTASDYHITNKWRVYGTVDEVSAVFGEKGSYLPIWWPSALFDAQDLSAGDEDGTGRSFSIRARGWLPLFSMRLQFTALEVAQPNHYILGVSGDLHGTAAWTFEQDEEMVNITFDWRLTIVQPLLQRLSGILRPLFLWNHDWIMLQGERSLALELLRRSTPEADRDAIPAPPGPAKFPLKEVVAIKLVGLLAVAAVVYRWRRR